MTSHRHKITKIKYYFSCSLLNAQSHRNLNWNGKRARIISTFCCCCCLLFLFAVFGLYNNRMKLSRMCFLCVGFRWFLLFFTFCTYTHTYWKRTHVHATFTRIPPGYFISIWEKCFVFDLIASFPNNIHWLEKFLIINTNYTCTRSTLDTPSQHFIAIQNVIINIYKFIFSRSGTYTNFYLLGVRICAQFTRFKWNMHEKLKLLHGNHLSICGR